MPLIQVNTVSDRPIVCKTLLQSALRRTDGPVCILVHGYKFSPSTRGFSPHRHILALRPDDTCPKALSWPTKLGFTEQGGGLCLAFGWEARGSIWRAYGRAATTGHALARLISSIKQIAPKRDITLMAHSLGSRVVLSGLQLLPPHSVRRAVLLAAADYRSVARKAMSSPAGRTAEVVNITSRENDLYDYMLGALIPSVRFGDTLLGRGLGARHTNWTDISLSCPTTLAELNTMGFAIAETGARMCHWSVYLRPGVFQLYRALLRHPNHYPVARLQNITDRTAFQRHDRLAPKPVLPFVQKTSS
ncbi:alpha/beta hydrolase [Pseudaestuariivita rosea]|uniref:alpha/beta hydrolase n=1 Tax=Pseudaestuariivita rosea TaxID=2763263 RepID=UPI001ABA403A|nr:alpha/beta hydrolase [Pseudaestuariivita rosea]